MSVSLNSIPTSNTLRLKATFLQNGVAKATLNAGDAKNLNIAFDSIGVGSRAPLSVYKQEGGNVTISPGDLAFVDRSVVGKIALRYGTHNGKQHNVIFALDTEEAQQQQQQQ